MFLVQHFQHFHALQRATKSYRDPMKANESQREPHEEPHKEPQRSSTSTRVDYELHKVACQKVPEVWDCLSIVPYQQLILIESRFLPSGPLVVRRSLLVKKLENLTKVWAKVSVKVLAKTAVQTSGRQCREVCGKEFLWKEFFERSLWKQVFQKESFSKVFL